MGFLTKKTDYGYKEKISVYAYPIESGRQKGAKRRTYAELSETEKKKSDRKKESYYKKMASELVELACMNDFKCMVTLTFRENITDYDTALAEWQKFLKRLRLNIQEFKYIAVWEYQKRGAFHFHVLFDFCIDHKKLTGIWKNGFIWMTSIKNKNDTLTQMRYMTKYIVKGLAVQPQNKKKMRFFFTSNNLNRPTIETFAESADLDAIIFERMEDMILDGAYKLKNDDGLTVNRCEYVEFLKS